MDTPLRIATAQSPIVSDVRQNGRAIRDLMRQASDQGAKLVHFPEGAMSGYVKRQIQSWDGVDWSALHNELETTARLADTLNLWVVMGCNHRLTPPHRPHNSLYVISNEGELHTRYDKQRISHSEITDWYSPGSPSTTTFTVEGMRFGCALCIEINFPEHFMDCAEQGVQCVLFSSYSDNPMFGIQAQGHAANHNFWVSVSVPVAMSGPLSSRLIGPSGRIISACDSGRAAIVVHDLDPEDPAWTVALKHARPWRAAARQGDIYADRAVIEDPRSADKTRF